MLAGTYLGLVEKLDYLQTLGVNAIELLPVQEFNELEYYQVCPVAPVLRRTLIVCAVQGVASPHLLGASCILTMLDAQHHDAKVGSQ